MRSSLLTTEGGAGVSFDLAGLVREIAGQVEKAEVIVRVGRNVRRVGHELMRLVGEMEGLGEKFDELGMNSKKLTQPIRRVAGEILVNTSVPVEEIGRKVDILQTMMEMGSGIDEELEQAASTLVTRWEGLEGELTAVLVRGGNWDLPFPVRVERNEGGRVEETWAGRESGTTYWHNLRSNAMKLWGRMEEEDNRVWLDAKRRLGEGEGVVREGRWTFIRE